MKKIVYVDMDNVLVDFPSGIAKLDDSTRQKFADDLDELRYFPHGSHGRRHCGLQFPRQKI